MSRAEAIRAMLRAGEERGLWAWFWFGMEYDTARNMTDCGLLRFFYGDASAHAEGKAPK